MIAVVSAGIIFFIFLMCFFETTPFLSTHCSW
ncbi:hypothetical protein C9I44_00800 [Lactococcus garvieae]|nr:hypothetical protein C9I44_00800 [Lactococcus garvieae]